MQRIVRRVLPTLLLAVVATAPVAACSRAPKAGDEAPAPNAPATLRVQNRAFADMVIYIVSSSGSRQRLGTVTGNSTGRFTLPATATSFGNVRFLADPIGSNRTPISEEINVRPGDEVVLEIPPQ